MASNIEGSSTGSKRRRSSSKVQVPDPLPTGSILKRDSTIKSILRKKVHERLDIEKTKSSLSARIKLLKKHASERMTPSGLRIQCVRAKGQNADALQAVFKDIILDAERKLLDVATDSLHKDVVACQEEIQEHEKDIDGTIAQWKTHLLKVKEITPDQVEKLIETAATFAEKLSSESAVTRASKSLQAEITQRESNKREDIDSNEPFVPTESSIREIICQEIHHVKEPHTASGNRQRRVSFSDNSGRRSRTKHQPQLRKKSKSPQNRTKEQRKEQQKQQSQKQGRSKSPRSNPGKWNVSPRSSAKNARAKVLAPQNRQTLLS